MIPGILEFLLNIDQNLPLIVSQYGAVTYVILFLIIMLETGLVFMPFLPGDSLLFVSGTSAANGFMDVYLLILLLGLAAIIGDSLNYTIGQFLGGKLIDNPRQHLIKKEHIEKTCRFYDKYGGLTIVIARFIPYVRSIAPFLAGVGTMQYRTFLMYNIIGAFLWTVCFVLAGYFIGTIPVVQENFDLVIYLVLGLAVFSAIGVAYGIIRTIYVQMADARKNGKD
jgi:membrane-associated protein